MRFDLSRLGSREFEHLTQSIAVSELGPGVGVFGSGADGGREATFDGPVPVVTNGHAWSGYGVIQAKYKETLGKPKDDATWLIGEIDEEMKGWRKRKAENKKIPEYFLLSTNVRLSPQDEGGIDRVDACLEKHAKQLGFKGWLVWHSDSISTFLANHREVRTTYAPWVTPGDVLAEVLSDQGDLSSEISDALSSFTAKELLRERYVNLDQAGATDDGSVALADILIDLPYQPWSGIEEAASGHSQKALKSIIHASDQGVDQANGRKHASRNEVDNRFVLVGGPGQGKTTITQFACQMFRASLVADTPAGRFGKVKLACQKIKGLMDQEGLAVPNKRRWPVNIQLTRLADDVARGGSTSLLGYLAKIIAARTTVSVSAHDLRKWLAAYPWFVVLDGLDEVPAASNRGEILALIDDFLVEVASVNADVFVVATTRPQGYTDEFSPSHYKHLQLTSLTYDIAMSYGKKLAIARHGSESDRTDRLIERLERAYVEPATSRLMSSPLQVTILAVLLERVGQAPKDRYNLFADYYRVIYDRELEKDSQASALLRDHHSDVDAIHAHVGLLLQTRSEHSGETHSTLEAQELGEIVRVRLAKEGHRGDALSALCKQVIKAATERLVFLVSTRSDEIGFEIRSLQEFWAAQGIMQKPEALISDSLRKISSSSHWRNTLLFAFGHIFSKREHLRDTVIALVSELNSHSVLHGEVKKAILAGSRLATSVLSDGMVRSPVYLQSLTDQAVRLFQLPPDPDVRMVPSVISQEMIEVVLQLADDRLHDRAEADDVSLLYGLSVLSSRPDLSSDSRAAMGDFIAPLYERLTPESKTQLMSFAYRAGNATLRKLTQFNLIEAPLPNVIDVLSGPAVGRRRNRSTGKLASDTADPAWVRAFRGAIRHTSPGNEGSASSVEILGFDAQLNCVQDVPAVWERVLRAKPPAPTLVHEAALFCCNPGARSLATFLEFASSQPESLRFFENRLPWVVAQVLAEQPTIADAVVALRDGDYGDLQNWIDLEDSWVGEMDWRVTLNGMKDYFESGAPFYPLAAAKGSYMLPRPDSDGYAQCSQIFERYTDTRTKNEGIQAAFASWLLTQLFVKAHGRSTFVDEVGPSSVLEVLQDCARSAYFNVGWIDRIDTASLHLWSDCLDFAGQRAKRLHPAISRERVGILLDFWLQDPRRWGLARLSIAAGRDSSSLSRDARYSHVWRSDAIAGELPKRMSLLVAGVLGEPATRREARSLSDEILTLADSKYRWLAVEAMREMQPGESQLSRAFCLMCAEGLSWNSELRQTIIERLVEAFGKDASGMGAS
ncbi:NACHT domain-containing protein [Streptomyces sp. NPDC086782]|uniref:NACHT domain-containing protein n=1 Tax=Streptomyces sp. NPDC086782 TaxID=3365757 RepID=UPI003819C13A